MSENRYTTAQALKSTRYHTYLKGKEYCRAGKVDIVSSDESGALALVAGTNEYKVILTWADQDLLYECSCPFDNDKGGACKHVVATILKLAGDKGEIETIKEAERWQMPEMTFDEAKDFIVKIVSGNTDLQDELRIFLKKESRKNTSENYDEKFARELEQIDWDELLESWYRYNEMSEYDDGYYGDDMEEGDDNNQLAMWVADVIDLMQKNIKYDDYGEVMQIGGAAVNALINMERQIMEEMSDLSDWFDMGVNQVLEQMSKLHILFNKEQLGIARSEWERLLVTQGNDDYSGTMVEALVDILVRMEDWGALGKHVDKYVLDYPTVSVPQLEYLQKSGQKEKLIELATKVLAIKEQSWQEQYFMSSNYYDRSDLVIKVRRILARVYSDSDDREKRTKNLEELFLASHQIMDYEVLRNEYGGETEREKFWVRMEKCFGQHGAKDSFAVYKQEGEKERILKLIERYPEAENFADMVREVRETYPEQCFDLYRRKIEKLLIPTNTSGYDNVAYHLSQMREIGERVQFDEYLESVKQRYKKRRRMMESLARKKL